MRIYSRRSILSAIGAMLPFGLGTRAGASTTPAGTPPTLHFRPFEEAVREAFAGHGRGSVACRIEIGHSPDIQAGVQGCHNDRPFAGFPEGHLRIVRAGTEPGPVRQGVRLYVSTVDVARAGGLAPGVPSRPLDFAAIPPAPIFA